MDFALRSCCCSQAVVMSAIPGLGNDEHYEEPMPPHEDEPEQAEVAQADTQMDTNASHSNGNQQEPITNGTRTEPTSAEMASTASAQVTSTCPF